MPSNARELAATEEGLASLNGLLFYPTDPSMRFLITPAMLYIAAVEGEGRSFRELFDYLEKVRLVTVCSHPVTRSPGHPVTRSLEPRSSDYNHALPLPTPSVHTESTQPVQPLRASKAQRPPWQGGERQRPGALPYCRI